MPLTKPIATCFNQAITDLIKKKLKELNAESATGREWQFASTIRMAMHRGLQEWGWIDSDGQSKQNEPESR